jgi:S1-C subfamily serine protease
MRGLALLLVVIGGAGIAVSPQRAPEPASGPEVYQRTASASAWVLASGQGKGTGFVVDVQKRLLVTCYHVVGENETCEIIFLWKQNDRTVTARRLYLEHMPDLQKRGLAVGGKVIRRNREKDLALIVVPALPEGVTALPLAPNPVTPGERVWAVGNRYDSGTLFTAAAGRVRSVHRVREGYFSGGRHLAKGARLILADVPINEGDSGGPLVNERAEVVGVSAAVAWEAHGGGLFVDRSELRAFLEQSDSPMSILPSAGATVYRRALRSTALVLYEGGPRAAGVVVDRARRLVLTTADSVAKEKTVEVTFASGENVESAWYLKERDLLRRKGHLSTGTVLVVDARRNLALIEVERLPQAVTEAILAKSPALPAEALHLLTHPARLEALWAYSGGIVRQRDQFALGRFEGPPPMVIIAQSSLSDGECGPAFDDRGELVGFASGKIGPQQQIAYLLDACEIRDFLEEVRPTANPQTVDEHLARAELFVLSRQFTKAHDEYTAALSRDSKNAAALAGRAWVDHLRNRQSESLADAAIALDIDSKQIKARCARAAVWLARGEPRRALAECDLAVKSDPKYPLSFALRALAKLESGDAAGALADADESIWLDSKLALAYLARGRIRSAREQPDRAAEDFARAIALDPQYAEAYRRRGDLAWQRSDVNSALADYSQTLKFAPEDALALFGRGRARLAKGQHDGGLADLDDAIRRLPEFADAYLVRGGEKVRRNWLNKGAADLLDSVRRRPALLAAVLAEVERKAADLPAADESEAYRLVLEGVRGNLELALQKRVGETLATAKAEKDDRKRAELLRAIVGVVRAKVSER